MYAFSRSVRFAPGNIREAMTWATEVREHVNQITGLGVRLFTQVWSPELGRVSWACFVPDLSALEAANDKLLADDSFASKVDQGARFLSGALTTRSRRSCTARPIPAAPSSTRLPSARCALPAPSNAASRSAWRSPGRPSRSPAFRPCSH